MSKRAYLGFRKQWVLAGGPAEDEAKEGRQFMGTRPI